MLALAQRYSQVAQEVLADNLVAVVLFGSVARGEARANSDIDLLIVCHQLPHGVFSRQTILEPVRQQLQSELDHLWQQGCMTDFTEHLKTKEEAARPQFLYLDMTEEAIILFDQDAFFASVLDKLRIHLRQIGAQQQKLGQSVTGTSNRISNQGRWSPYEYIRSCPRQCGKRRSHPRGGAEVGQQTAMELGNTPLPGSNGTSSERSTAMGRTRGS
jgi:hypothetical protein